MRIFWVKERPGERRLLLGVEDVGCLGRGRAAELLSSWERCCAGGVVAGMSGPGSSDEVYYEGRVSTGWAGAVWSLVAVASL